MPDRFSTIQPATKVRSNIWSNPDSLLDPSAAETTPFDPSAVETATIQTKSLSKRLRNSLVRVGGLCMYSLASNSDVAKRPSSEFEVKSDFNRREFVFL
jgi:hypothetical protein